MKSDLLDQMYALLTRRSYNRGLPYLPIDLRRVIEQSIKNNQPIRLVGFWGIGHKATPGKPELDSCSFLKKLHNDIKIIYPPGIHFLFLLADQHALHNGYSRETIASYGKGMEALFTQFDFEWIYLHALWKKYELRFENIDEKLHSMPRDWWEKTENTETIERNARHRNKVSTPKEAAQRYFIMRDLEKDILEREYKGCIFHAFSDPELKNVLPQMPTLYFYARKGWSNAPWFAE